MNVAQRYVKQPGHKILTWEWDLAEGGTFDLPYDATILDAQVHASSLFVTFCSRDPAYCKRSVILRKAVHSSDLPDYARVIAVAPLYDGLNRVVHYIYVERSLVWNDADLWRKCQNTRCGLARSTHD